MSDIVASFLSVPPVTRTLVAATLIESVLTHSGLLSIRTVFFYKPYIFKLFPDVWRLFTPFLLTGRGLNFIFDLYFLWKYCSEVELNSPKFTGPGDFFVYIMFVATVILSTAGFVLSAFVFTQALILALAYTYALSNPGKKTTFVIVQIPVIYLPWAMLAFSLVMNGWQGALEQGTGIIGAHAHEFLTRIYPTYQGGRNWLATPRSVKRAFGGEQRASTVKGYGTGYRPADRSAAASSKSASGWSSAFSNPWGGRGPGRRLGSG